MFLLLWSGVQVLETAWVSRRPWSQRTGFWLLCLCGPVTSSYNFAAAPCFTRPAVQRVVVVLMLFESPSDSDAVERGGICFFFSPSLPPQE